MIKILNRVALCATVLASVAFAQTVVADHTPDHKIGLDGYCPVCIVEAKKWEKGRADIQSRYDGVTYYFPNENIKKKFDANPAAYVPALGGDCTVCYDKVGKRVPGSIHHTVLHKRRLYLFPSAKEKQAFLKSPKAFENVDLASNGDCVVCLMMAKKKVAGKTDFTEVHGGMRYLFPSAREREAFRADPKKYAVMKKASNKIGAAMMKKSSQVATFVGKSACAGCEYGLKPLGDPGELGLAIKTNNGQIIVVEKAHQLYPKAYANRFQGQQLQVEGTILKSDGQYAWLKPSSLSVIY